MLNNFNAFERRFPSITLTKGWTRRRLHIFGLTERQQRKHGRGPWQHTRVHLLRYWEACSFLQRFVYCTLSCVCMCASITVWTQINNITCSRYKTKHAATLFMILTQYSHSILRLPQTLLHVWDTIRLTHYLKASSNFTSRMRYGEAHTLP
jgi:tRNA(Arg) A34 adenosine deaminase TadA